MEVGFHNNHLIRRYLRALERGKFQVALGYLTLLGFKLSSTDKKEYSEFKETVKVKSKCSVCGVSLNLARCCVTECSHLFCDRCIFAALDQYNHCPVCRKKLHKFVNITPTKIYLFHIDRLSVIKHELKHYILFITSSKK